MSGANAKPQHQIVGALCLGEYGKLVDLSKEPKILTTVQGLFKSGEDNVRTAASICLGNVSIGNPDFFLDKVFTLVKQASEAQKYLFLNTIKEIVLHDSKCLEMYLGDLIDLLMNHATTKDELVKSTVAESLGRLLPAYPGDIGNAIEEGLRAGAPSQKATLARSVKYGGDKCEDQLQVEMIAAALLGLEG